MRLISVKILGIYSVFLLSFSSSVAAAQSTNDYADSQFPSLSLSSTIGLYSDYVFRGISQTGETPALQGNIDLEHDSGFYAGVWASNVDFGAGDDADLEIDYYGGFRGNLINDSFGYDIGAVYYSYPGVDSDLDFDYPEIFASLSYNLNVASVRAGVNYAPEFFADSGDAFYTYASTNIPLSYGFNMNGAIGYQSIDDNAAFGVPDYFDWSAGVSYALSEIDPLFNGMVVSVTYTDTNVDRSDCADGCDARAVGYISYAL